MDEANEQARQAQLERLRQTHEAYLKVFGPPGNRTVYGEVILKDLERFARFGDTAVTRDMQGRYDGGATAYNTGLQDVVKRIHLKIDWSEDVNSSSGSDER